MGKLRWRWLAVSAALTQLLKHTFWRFLLRQQYNHSVPGSRDAGQGALQVPLLRATLALAAQGITHRLDALHAHQSGLGAVDPSLDQRQVQLALIGVLIGRDLEFAVSGMQGIDA
ncbi:hypothetical protein D9M71_441880 [compost metagenome]